MSIALDLTCLQVLLAIDTAVELSVVIAVACWGWPNSSRATLIGRASWAFIYNAPTSDSAADARTFFWILARLWMAPL